MRAIRITLIVAVVLGALFVGADRLAVYFAENQAAEKIRSSQNLSGTPDVSIKGFPFLTQVADSRLDEVEVKLDGITANAGDRSIRVTGFNAKLRDVRINSSFTSAVADRATGTAHISYADLTKATGDPNVTVGFGGTDRAGASQVKVTGKISLMGQAIERSVLSTVTVAGGDTIRVRADEIPTEGIPGVEQLIRQKIDFDRKISGLPKGITVDKVVTTQDGVDITLTGSKINLAG
ncbi:LmeA family phospholipid-binding protein [Streptomyces sp. NPDC002537]